MTFRVPGSRRPGTGRPIALPRWPRFVLSALIVVVLVAVLIAVIAGIWTDFLWFQSVHQTRVFSVTYSTKWLLFGVVAAFMILAVGSNIWLAYRLRPPLPPRGSEHQGVEAYRQVIDPHRRGVLIVLLALIGLVTGLVAASNWKTWLLYVNRVPFGRTDPQFHLDISFFAFVYPFLRLALSFLFTAVLLSLVLAAVVHVLYGGLRLSRHANPSRGARAQLFVLAGVFVALKAAAYWVDRYGIDFSQRGVVQTGASYTDVHAVLPAKTVLAVIALICAALLLAGAFRRSALLPAIGLGLLVLSAVIIGGVYPFIIQQFVVTPNQQARERPYIKREITSTRNAYGVAGVTVVPYKGISPAQTKATVLAREAITAPDLRLIDSGLMSTTFEQLQQVKSYYQFQRVLAMDRYVYGSSKVPQDTVVGIRDMHGPPGGQANWVNTHLIYTHGYGFVASSASTAQADGSPSFIERDIPPVGQLGKFQPRVYFGHEGASYVIAGSRQSELDFPNPSSGGQHNNTYRGGGGVPIGSLASRLAFAVRFRELNILLSSAIDANSRILYIRDPLQRVEKVAPFLTLDGDAYPVIADHQILWVVDGYTTTDNYPYSERIGLGRATSSTYSPGGLAVGPAGQINYIRNSVKATVNAYTGAVHLYQWGKASPVLQAWQKSFPGLIAPQRDIPGDLLPHLRYPEVLFEAQRLILTKFHVTDPAAFYGGQNFWAVPSDPSILENKAQERFAGVSQPPYYLTLNMPHNTLGPVFSLTSVLTFHDRANLAAFVAVNSDPASPQYGHIEILQLPQNQVINGPGQIQNQFENFPAASIQLTQLRKGGSQVIQGNLVTIPLSGGFLSVEPVYVSASARANTGAYPQLKRVFTYFGGDVGYGSSLGSSLAGLFGSIGQQSSGQGGGTGHVSALVRQYLAQAEKYYAQAQAALRNGQGLGAYYQDIQKMKMALDRARQAAGAAPAAPGTSPSPAPSGSPAAPSPSASP